MLAQLASNAAHLADSSKLVLEMERVDSNYPSLDGWLMNSAPSSSWWDQGYIQECVAPSLALLMIVQKINQP